MESGVDLVCLSNYILSNFDNYQLYAALTWMLNQNNLITCDLTLYSHGIEHVNHQINYHNQLCHLINIAYKQARTRVAKNMYLWTTKL